MPLTEEEIDTLEARFPLLADVAFARARDEALAAGLSVLEAENGVIYEQFPDGRRIPIKRIAPPVHYPPGTVFRIE